MEEIRQIENVDVMKSAYNYRSNQNILHYDLKSHLRLLEHVRKNPKNKGNKYIRPLSPKHNITPVCAFDSFHSKRSGEYYRFSVDRLQSSSRINLYDSNTGDIDHNNENVNIKDYKGLRSEKDLKDLHQQYFKFINNRDHKKMKQSNINSHLFKKIWNKPEITELNYKPYHQCKTKIEDHPELIVKDSSTITAIGSTILALEGTSNSMNYIMDRNNNNHHNSLSTSERPLSPSDMCRESRHNIEPQHHQLLPSSSLASSSSSRPSSAILHSSRRNSGVVPAVQHQSLPSQVNALSSSSQSMRHMSPIKSEASQSSSLYLSTTAPRPRSAVPQSTSPPPSSSTSTSKSSVLCKSRPRSAAPFTTSPIAESSQASLHSSSVIHHQSSRPHSAAPLLSTSPISENHKSIKSRPQSSPTHSQLTAYRSSNASISSHIQSNAASTTILVSIRPHSAVPQSSSPTVSPYLIIPPRPKSATPNIQLSRSQSRPSSNRRRKPKLNNFHTRY